MEKHRVFCCLLSALSVVLLLDAGLKPFFDPWGSSGHGCEQKHHL